MRYIIKPLTIYTVVVDAVQFFPDHRPWPEGVKEVTRRICSDPQCGDSSWDHACDLGEGLGVYELTTSKGKSEVWAEDWIITSLLTGEKYSCKPDVFAALLCPDSGVIS